MKKIIIKDRVYVPRKSINLDEANKLFVHNMFNDMMCNKCPYKPDRDASAKQNEVNETCAPCDGFKGSYKLYSEKELNGKPYIGFPTGNRSKLKQLIDISKFKVLDKRPHPKIKFDIEFNFKILTKMQKKAVRKMIEKKYGILRSMPRTGKTIMAIAIALKKKLKVLIMAHQDDLLKQFKEHLYDPMFTNIRAIEKFEGRKLVYICRTVEEFLKYPICLATYQTFLSTGGKKKLEKIKDKFGVLIIDEAHSVGAAEYSKVVNKFNVAHKYGLTATPERKDGKHILVRDIIGPIAHKTRIKPLTPVIEVVDTGLIMKKNFRGWTAAMRFIEESDERNKLIVKHAVADLKAGHSLVIPVTFNRHANTLTRMINKAYGKDIAAKFTGQVSKDDRRKVILRARANKIKCVVAMRQMLIGINVPRWSCVYEIMPMNNHPKFEQEIMRVCTPMEGKLKPVIKFFIDNHNISRACFRSCVTKLKKMQTEYGGFEFTKSGFEKMREHMRQYYASKKGYGGGYGDPYKPQKQNTKDMPITKF